MTYTKAWVTLLTHTKYAVGVQVLARSLQKVQSQYPLVVLYTPATISESVLNLLSRSGCITRPTQNILPEGKIDYMWDYYPDTWTKLRAWELDEFDRVVLLDADMLCMQNMDELLAMPLQEGWVAACHACTCNLAKISKYPADWTPENCGYTGCDKSASINAPPTSKKDYFNSGLIVIEPSKAAFDNIVQTLMATPDPNVFRFPDQDFLNVVYKGRWEPLPYIYNALKTLPSSHGPMWDIEHVKNAHYILTKPWDVDMAEAKENNDQFYDLYTLWWNTYAECWN
ncbi:nucleotide-diphospho-sugar transferase [Endogone sp. FLAS-F59071]|nr:nucleotide-diphospho-sugar transferase [Endogone sp. FLAS-F59071]|eukprot:RUS18433.1 nucleotide-diphospho-sugar transferase [Endogone sp. FLAS-F59071]